MTGTDISLEYQYYIPPDCRVKMFYWGSRLRRLRGEKNDQNSFLNQSYVTEVLQPGMIANLRFFTSGRDRLGLLVMGEGRWGQGRVVVTERVVSGSSEALFATTIEPYSHGGRSTREQGRSSLEPSHGKLKIRSFTAFQNDRFEGFVPFYDSILAPPRIARSLARGRF